MKIETTFSCGDKAWVYMDGPMEVTIGHVRVEYTHSKGLKGGKVDDSLPVAFDNYKPKAAKYEEVYMAVETGIGSGTLWKMNESIFRTEDECIKANEQRIAERRLYEEARRQRDIEYAKQRIRAAKQELARLGEA